MPTMIAPTDKGQKKAFSEEAKAFEARLMGPVGDAVKARWTTFHAVLPIIKRAGMNPKDVLGAELYQANIELDKQAKYLANMVAGLQRKKLSIIWTRETEKAPVVLSVIYADKVPRKNLGAFPIIPVILVGLGAAAVGAILYLWNGGPATLNAKAEAEATEAKNRARELEILAEIARQNPQAANYVVKRLEASRKKADEKDNEDFWSGLADKFKAGGIGIAAAVALGLLLLASTSNEKPAFEK